MESSVRNCGQIGSVATSCRIYSPLFTQHLAVMRSSPVVRDLVFSAYDDAVSAVGASSKFPAFCEANLGAFCSPFLNMCWRSMREVFD